MDLNARISLVLVNKRHRLFRYMCQELIQTCDFRKGSNNAKKHLCLYVLTDTKYACSLKKIKWKSTMH